MSATTNKRFYSMASTLGSFDATFSQDVIKTEPMFFNATPKFAYDNGGPITRAFLKEAPDIWWKNAVLDSRVHMLMPGWYPAIPGYHHDDVPRPPIPVGQHFMTAGQPDYDNPRYRSQHLMGLVNGDICPTRFAIGECIMPAIPEGELIYRRWHTEVESLIAAGKMQTWDAPSGALIRFDCDTFHTGTKAVGNGWRWFCRITINSDRCHKITNEIRSQVQVYLEFPMDGW